MTNMYNISAINIYAKLTCKHVYTYIPTLSRDVHVYMCILYILRLTIQEDIDIDHRSDLQCHYIELISLSHSVKSTNEANE